MSQTKAYTHADTGAKARRSTRPGEIGVPLTVMVPDEKSSWAELPSVFLRSLSKLQVSVSGILSPLTVSCNAGFERALVSLVFRKIICNEVVLVIVLLVNTIGCQSSPLFLRRGR